MSGITQESQMNSNTRAIRPLLLVGIASLSIAASGCGWIKDKTHYQSSKEASPLEVPPDMDKPDTSAATALPAVSSAGAPPPSMAGRYGHLGMPVADAYPKIGEILAATPGVTVNGKAEALSSYDITYKGESFLLRVLDASGGSRLVALSPDGRLLTSGNAAELVSTLLSKF